MSTPELPAHLATPLLRTLLEIARQAAEVVREIYEGAYDVEMKGPDDPVTTADKRANQIICDALRQAFPACPVVAEESEPTAYGDYRRAERFFLVDPVDGTREFVKRTGEFVVMLGCVEEHRATAGVIWSPTDGTRWAGLLGEGAVRAEADGPFRAISPSDLPEFADGTVLVSRAQGESEAARIREALGCTNLVAMGSAGLKGAAVADGRANAYVARKYAGKRWDACAPDAIVSAAGGLFSDSRGTPIDYRSEDLRNQFGLVASGERTHATIIARLNRGAPKPV
jgi:3'(2'), 5'-bisphosphate nucleotidase